jgi:hypothetical protein
MGHGKHGTEDGRPAAEPVQRAYDDADLARAIQAYKFFYPTVSGAAIVKGNEQIGVVPNKVFGILDCAPEQLSSPPTPIHRTARCCWTSVLARWWSSYRPVP